MTTLVLASSLGTTRAMWEPVLPLLRDRYDEVVAYDHPGHGSSPTGPRTLEGLAQSALEHMPERPDFCGVSLGGMVGIWLAANAADRIGRLILCCTAPSFAPAESWEERARLARERGMAAIADSVVERWFTPEFRLRERYRQMILATPPEGYARACEALRDADLRGGLARIAAPTLVVTGSDDPAVSGDDTALLTSIRGARHVELPGRHLAPIEHPDLFAEAL